MIASIGVNCSFTIRDTYCECKIVIPLKQDCIRSSRKSSPFTVKALFTPLSASKRYSWYVWWERNVSDLPQGEKALDGILLSPNNQPTSFYSDTRYSFSSTYAFSTIQFISVPLTIILIFITRLRPRVWWQCTSAVNATCNAIIAHFRWCLLWQTYYAQRGVYLGHNCQEQFKNHTDKMSTSSASKLKTVAARGTW